MGSRKSMRWGSEGETCKCGLEATEENREKDTLK